MSYQVFPVLCWQYCRLVPKDYGDCLSGTIPYTSCSTFPGNKSPPPPASNQSPSDNGGNSKGGPSGAVIGGAVAGSVLGVILIVAFVYFLCRYLQQKKLAQANMLAAQAGIPGGQAPDEEFVNAHKNPQDEFGGGQHHSQEGHEPDPFGAQRY